MKKEYDIYGGRLTKDQREKLREQGLFAYDLRSWDEGMGFCIEYRVIVNHEGVLITNFQVLDPNKYDDFIEDGDKYLEEQGAEDTLEYSL